ncbi:DoxX family protein [Amycolatopsis taiwanensis]|uniref:DoxX family protein n=1 Tax=Amycolatopsis taiwanensis TaxID=342230 RepID=UPI000489AA44|nr:DoxX family protein [Amycolatopsis taiwanensis]
MTAHDDEYGRHNLFSDSGYYNTTGSQDTTVVAGSEDDYEDTRPSNRWHGGLDFGLLIMRLALGGTLGAHGLAKVFGTFGGPGISEFAHQLAGEGFTSQLTLLSWLGGIAEIAGGGLLILGLFTPAAASVLLALTALAVYLKYDNGFFLDGNGFEYHLMLAAMAFGLLFTGPGRVSLDVNTRWRRNPVPLAFLGIALAAAAVVVVVVVFR